MGVSRECEGTWLCVALIILMGLGVLGGLMVWTWLLLDYIGIAPVMPVG